MRSIEKLKGNYVKTIDYINDEVSLFYELIDKREKPTQDVFNRPIERNFEEAEVAKKVLESMSTLFPNSDGIIPTSIGDFSLKSALVNLEGTDYFFIGFDSGVYKINDVAGVSVENKVFAERQLEEIFNLNTNMDEYVSIEKDEVSVTINVRRYDQTSDTYSVVSFSGTNQITALEQLHSSVSALGDLFRGRVGINLHKIKFENWFYISSGVPAITDLLFFLKDGNIDYSTTLIDNPLPTSPTNLKLNEKDKFSNFFLAEGNTSLPLYVIQFSATKDSIASSQDVRFYTNDITQIFHTGIVEQNSNDGEKVISLINDNSKFIVENALGFKLFEISGDGNLLIQSDTVFQGETTYISTTNLSVEDNIIELNKPDSGLPVPADSGIIVIRDTADGTSINYEKNPRIIWDTLENVWKMRYGSSDAIKNGNILTKEFAEDDGLDRISLKDGAGNIGFVRFSNGEFIFEFS